MAVTIDLYDCDIHELEDHVSNPQLSMRTLELYVQETLKLIDQQKADDKAAEPVSSPRSRSSRSRRTKLIDPLENIDAISITSSTTSSRPVRRTRGRKQSESHTNTRRSSSRKTSRSNRIEEEDESDEEDMELDDFVMPTNNKRSNSVEYDWFSGIDIDDDGESSSDDPLLQFDPTNLDNDTFDTLFLGDKPQTTHTSSKSKKSSKKKKKKKHKTKEKKKKKKHKKKSKSKRKKRNESDDDFMLSTDDDDYDTINLKHYEERITSWSLTQLEKEEKSLERQVENEQKKIDSKHHHHHHKGGEQSETEQELNKLSLAEIEAKLLHKINHIKRIAHTEDPSKLYCICREPYDGTTKMICCDYCQEWYHLSCIGLSAAKLASVEQLKFKCPVCNGADPNDITNTSNNRHLGVASFDSPKSTPQPMLPMDDKRKYERLLMEFQLRLKEVKQTVKKEKKAMNERLARAKRDIDEERSLRMAIEAHMEGAKKKSDSMVKELGESLKHQKAKEAELVNKLKKLEANKKKYKESASENKKKMKHLSSQHENRLHELEDALNKASAHKKKYLGLEEQLQEQMAAQQQATNTINNTYLQYNKLQQQMSNKSAEAAKLHNLNSQLKHKMDALHVQAQQNHQQWENIAKVKADKIERLDKQIAAFTNNMPPLQQVTNNMSTSGSNTPRPPSPIKMPPTPGYLKFNDLELEELKMCRELCQKLLEANLFQVEHMAARAQLTRELFVSWVTGIGGKSPTVINDLNQATMGTLPSLDPQQHLSMNCIRLLLIEIRKQLETIVNETASHDLDTINKVKSLLREFQTASQSYEQKMTEFKRIQHDRLLEGCRSQGSVLEMFVVTGTNENNEPKSEWINVTVCNFDQNNNRVLVRKSNDQSMAYAAIDAATLRLSNTNKTVHNVISKTNNYWTTTNNAPPMNFTQMNFNGIPAIPAVTFPVQQTNTILPPFNDLQANNNGGASTSDPIVIDDHAVTTHQRKREHHKKPKRSYESSSNDSSSSNDDDSDISSDSETESESHHSRHKKKKKKKHKKHKKRHKKHHKKSSKKKKKKKKKKKSAAASKKNGKKDKSVSISSTASTRKRRGTKRQAANGLNGSAPPPHKKRKIAIASTAAVDNYDVIDGGGDSDKNDSVCRICKHPGDLVCCEGCPSSYHADCIRPRVKPEWLDSFEDWHCPSCAPRFSYVPLKYCKTGQKWPHNKEPLLKDLKDFLKRHAFLERDLQPKYHQSRKEK